MKKITAKTLLGILTLVFLATSIPLAIFLFSQSQDIRRGASVEGGSVEVSLSPTSLQLGVGETAEAKIEMNTGNTLISAIKVQLLYPYDGEAPSIEASNLTSPLNWCSITEIDPSSGLMKINMSCFFNDPQGFSTENQKIVIGTFQLKPVSVPSQNPTEITFNPSKTKVNKKEGGADDAAIPTSKLIVTVGGGDSASPSPSPSDDASPSPSPEDDASPSPSPEDDASPSPSPEDDASPSPEVSPSPSPDDSNDQSDDTGGADISPSPTASPISYGGGSTIKPTALSVSTIKENQTVTTSLPKITGKAIPNSTVTVTVQSEPQTATVTADANGNWSFTPTKPLEVGSHTLIVQSVSPTGKSETSTVTFKVSTPVTGSASSTLIMISVGLALMLGGLYIQFNKAKNN